MIAVALIGVLVASAVLVAITLRLSSLVSTVLAGYVALLAETTALTVGLSPLHLVTRGGLAVAEAVLFAGALGLWLTRGRPGVPLRAIRPVVREIVRDPVSAAFLGLVAVALVYELVLVLTVPASNWDSLTYHLARTAAWVQHGGIYWIPNAPTDRMNEFQPIAEQQILFLFVATGKGALFALPQFVAQLALLAGVYGASRRLLFDARVAACAALFFATFSIVALEATTSQNDLVAASLPVAAMALLLGGAPCEIVVAGVAVGLGLGVKLTTALVLPVLVLLALRHGRRRLLLFVGGASAAFVSLGMWGFILNIVKTGHVLGHGGGRVVDVASPSFPGSLVTAVRVVYQLLDRSGFQPWTLSLLTAAAILVAVVAALTARLRGSRGTALIYAAATAGPFLAPLVVIVVAISIKAVGTGIHLPVHDPRTTVGRFGWYVNSAANEDFSGFGSLGGLAVLGISMLTIARVMRRRVGLARLALGLAVPVFVVLLVLQSKYNPWISRFLIIPVALTAPLFAELFRRRRFAIGVVLVAALTLVLTLVRNQHKPLVNAQVPPWRLTQSDAAELTWSKAGAASLKQINHTVPARACVGAVLGLDEPAYLLYGPKLQRRVTYLRRQGAPQAATRDGLTYVVIGDIHTETVAHAFHATGWTILLLPKLAEHSRWALAISPHRSGGHCAA